MLMFVYVSLLRNPLLEEVPGEAEAVQVVCCGVPWRKGGLQGTLHYGRVQCGLLLVDPLRWQYGASSEGASGAAPQVSAGPLPAVLQAVWHDIGTWTAAGDGRATSATAPATAAPANGGVCTGQAHDYAYVEQGFDEWWTVIVGGGGGAVVYRRRLLGVTIQLLLLLF